jgi:hypothetical protein
VNDNNLEVTVQDDRSQKRAQLSLDASTLYADAMMPSLGYAQWFAPANDGNAFVICDSLDPNRSKLQISCVDPRVTGGRRWLLTENDLRRIIGTKPERLAPFTNPARKTNQLPVLVHGYTPDGAASVYRLLLIDTATGNVSRSIELNVDRWPTTPIMSPDGRTFVYVDGTAERHTFKLMSLEDGRTLSEFDSLPNHGYVYPFAFMDQSRIVAADEYTIWAFDANAGWNAQRLFRLAEETDSQ